MDLERNGSGSNGASQVPKQSEELPDEILEIIRLQQSPRFLDVLSAAAVEPQLTLRLFTYFAPIFADTCSRWISQENLTPQKLDIIEAFARILPLAPHLSIYLEKYLDYSSTRSTNGMKLGRIDFLWEIVEFKNGCPSVQLHRLLLAAWRLRNFDDLTYSHISSVSRIQELLKHSDRAVRYLATRVFCQIISASDFKLEAMIREHVGYADPVIGDFDGQLVDLGFLSILEEDRLKDAAESMRNYERPLGYWNSHLSSSNLSPLVARYSNIILPRLNGPPTEPSSLVPTETSLRNMEKFGKALLSTAPILIHGLAGSGKTALVNDFARDLGVDDAMVTLHLNEQTDAKMLVGMYASGSRPGSFTWRAGVLTTAVREGRWVLVEDLDRAPNEVISVILPLIERRELHISSRGETIRAARGFRLIASIRTSLNVDGKASSPALHMLGARLWQQVIVEMPSQSEFQQIIDGTYPLVHHFLPAIVCVYQRLCTLSSEPTFASRNRTSLARPISPRDLLKWCRRLNAVLTSAGSKTGQEPISEAVKYEMFLEATDCFAGSLQTTESQKSVIYCIAEEMHIETQRVEHFLAAHIPRYDDSETQLTIGRVRLPKRNTGRVAKQPKRARPFANTTHAKRLLEQVGIAVKMCEPVLLVGETGIGKTAVVQQLAEILGVNLVPVNLSHQSEVGDLLGGFKPVNIRTLAIPLKEEFEKLFSLTGFSATRNERYLEQLGKCVGKSQWKKAVRYWREAPKMFEGILAELSGRESVSGRSAIEQPTKRRKTESKLQALLQLKPRWEWFSRDVDQLEIQLSGGSKGLAFSFVEGNIVKAARSGDWVLLDEINLASPDTLESIADLLHSGPGATPSILLSETGEIERIQAHPNFRIFGAMNPATDVRKRDLPVGLRSRFTEIYVESPDRNVDDLLGVVKAYLEGSSNSDERIAHDITRLYINTKRLADEKMIVDGANQVPHFSLRTLTRVLSYATELAPSYGLRRALYEGFAMGFLTLLNRQSERMLLPLIDHHLLETHGNSLALLSQPPRHPNDGMEYVRFVNKKRDRQYWVRRGSEIPVELPHYIITPFVERNMLNLVRAASTRRFPVLIQGPTSSGKTSMVEYLALFSGNKFVRINNHEYTDLQEYLGTYISTSDGQLRFQEGLLVQALRHGHWIVLDELNLAPTDVLEALNRLLDDNRELLIPETQEIVRPHENFMLFATQNPPGLYGGRKTLSRAFRNRFLELHFDDIPDDELDFILEKRSQNVAPSDCRRIVAVYKELSRLRQSNRLFEQKESFATLRDLFRWALRKADTRERLAENGYMLLAERVRNPEERKAVKEIIERVFKAKIDTDVLYDEASSPEIPAFNATKNAQGVVWSMAMRRLYVLVAQALRNNEPVLLVGETGCGKTTVCQMLADALGKELHIINAHQNTETGDLIGAQRPVRNRSAILELLKQELLQVLQTHGSEVHDSDDIESLNSTYRSLLEKSPSAVPLDVQRRISANQAKSQALFEWSDGSLVHAMKQGQFFLLDEISLADDSVLERLNSVLEPQRTILLAEKGVEDSFIQAADGFQFFATMNPGGDYGKRELSPALRNRFTEIWVPALSEHDDVFQIAEAKLRPEAKKFATCIVQFANWFGSQYRPSTSTSISVRDLLAWIKFVNERSSKDVFSAIIHGAAMVYIDTLGANPAVLLAINPESIHKERMLCLEQLSSLLQLDATAIYLKQVHFVSSDTEITIGEFSIPKRAISSVDIGFTLEAPTTTLNAMRVIRALQVQKPILLEGSPGVGKTTLIAALARATGTPLTRINLSEQTDLMDLFGSDVPVEGAQAGHFAWRDAPFLQAMQRGEWVLLDEMNLASQSVLEGLNACLDHRGEVYISELDQKFKRHPDFCVFAAQNPHHQGGGRKGLPSSFVNRFTVVYADVFRGEDLTLICRHSFPLISPEITSTLIRFVLSLEKDVVHGRRYGTQGGPWEFNLRDILRWLQLLSSSAPLLSAAFPADFINSIFRQRFRTVEDRREVQALFEEIFNIPAPFHHLFHNLTSTSQQVGLVCLPRDTLAQRQKFPRIDIRPRLAEIESVMLCIQQNIPCILVGPAGAGKTTLLEHVAATCGKQLVNFPLNADIDTIDLVGGFEQVDPQRAAAAFLSQLQGSLSELLLQTLPSLVPRQATTVLDFLNHADRAEAGFFTRLYQHLNHFESTRALPGLQAHIDTCKAFAKSSLAVENPQFEWVDGALIKALEKGDWLVLDNANLVSSSVLDRLNSLLEPNGFLMINEHCGLDGKPRIVKPHPEFRVFLTLNPRFGELSRAMRNRSIEIFLEQLSLDESSRLNIPFIHPEASMQRLHRVSDIAKLGALHNPQRYMLDSALDSLLWADIYLLPRFVESLSQKGVVTSAQMASLQKYCTMKQDPGYEKFRCVTRDNNGASKPLFGGINFRDAQTIHPLQNSPLVPFLQIIFNPYWLGFVFELNLDIIAAVGLMVSQSDDVAGLKPSQMNRLQRSLVRDRVKAVIQDSTVHASEFLTTMLHIILGYLKDFPVTATDWQKRRAILRLIVRFWWETYHLTVAESFDEAAFQAHIAIGSELTSRALDCSTQDPEHKVIQSFQSNLTQNFESNFKLSTGLSMETLWKHLRPFVISKRSTLETLLALEKLASRFDALRWTVSTSAKELGQVMASLVSSYNLTLRPEVDGVGLLESLKRELDALEAGTLHINLATQPFFVDIFEALRQYDAIDKFRSNTERAKITDYDLMVLSGYSTTTAMLLENGNSPSGQLQIIDVLWGNGDIVHPILNNFTPNLIRRLENVREVDLQSMRLLQLELSKLGEKIVRSGDALQQDQILSLNHGLYQLIDSVIAAHGNGTLQAYRVLTNSLRESVDLECVLPTALQELIYEARNQFLPSFSGPSHVLAALLENFVPAFIALSAAEVQALKRVEFSALAWIQFAEGCIHLYVPDRTFDPDKRQHLERDRHFKTRKDLADKLARLRESELLFTGQDSNLRCQLLETEIKELGEPPKLLQEVYRPEISELEQLQGEFHNLLKTAGGSTVYDRVVRYYASQDSSTIQELQLLQRNVVQIIRRLSERFKAYRDLTAPVISMLRCLQTGISIVLRGSRSKFCDTPPVVLLRQPIPFVADCAYTANPMTDGISGDLGVISATVAVEGTSRFGAEFRETIMELFHQRYEAWSQKLESDQLEAQSKGGLYRFRGSAEDENDDDEQEFNEIFPEYGDELPKATKEVPREGDTREVAIELANVHSDIFLGGKSPVQSILLLIRRATRHLAPKYEIDAKSSGYRPMISLLPGSMLLIRDQIEELGQTSSVRDSYNFYTDPNLPEARKLVILIYNIQARFQELQSNDEIGHMQPLEDILVSCRELLQLRHIEPLAKIITKVEKVHGFLYEWQFGGWASRANSALPQYDSLTTTIVNWRRLELSTWAKLLDIEVQKCEDDAKSWWFIAYQVTIAAPLQVSLSEVELRSYAAKLLKDLEIYFSIAIVGQFTHRLALLRQLEKHLKMLVLDHPTMAIIHSALANFLALYSRYQEPVDETLNKSRAGLEKEMRDVLLLASWKDTNIVALRDSAKRSHHKLFKIVRKFRAILGQSVESIIRQGLPDGERGIVEGKDDIELLNTPKVDEVALSYCAGSIPNWTTKSKRFLNVSKTVGLMATTCKVPGNIIHGPAYLDSFLVELTESMEELKKATPSVLDDKSKVIFKHLKTRKRKLFADTLKNLRTMGIKFNLGADALATQESQAAVFSRTSYIFFEPWIGGSRIDYYFYKCVDLVPRAREAARQHSRDLSTAEVTRSTGFLEGMLQMLLFQHDSAADAINLAERLNGAIKMAKALWAPTRYRIKRRPTLCSHEKVLRWLPHILNVAIELVGTHAKLGSIDSQPVVSSITSWSTKFSELCNLWDALPQLPDTLTTTEQYRLEQRLEDLVQGLRVELTQIKAVRPDLAIILDQVKPWTMFSSSPIPKYGESASVSELDEKLSSICDGVLVSAKKYKRSMECLPSSTDAAGWFTELDVGQTRCIKSLHCKTILKQLEAAFGLLDRLDFQDPDVSVSAGALFAMALPILEQYSFTVRQSVSNYARLHEATCKMMYVLSKSFIQIATQGFCTPPEKSDAQDGQTEKLEGGTGLGDGEGAEDISKDIQDDENLDELAQEPNTGESGEIEDQEDAVDIADGDMEGEMGDTEAKDEENGSEGGKGQDEIEEEAGDVDDLDPTAVDEKMWDGDGEQADKDQEGDDAKGKTSKDEAVAAAQEITQQAGEGEEGEEDEDTVGAEQAEEIGQEDIEKHDPHAQEGEALDLSEDMDLDGNEDKRSLFESEDGMDGLSDSNDESNNGEDEADISQGGQEESGIQDESAEDDPDGLSEVYAVELDGDDDDGGESTHNAGEKSESQDEEPPMKEDDGLLRDKNDESTTAAENAVSSDAQGVGEDQDESAADEQSKSASKAQREDGAKGAVSAERTEATTEDGKQSHQRSGEAARNVPDNAEQNGAAQPFKRLGDALERWHRQQTQATQPTDQNQQPQEQTHDADMQASDFQHLQDEDAEADAQALGTATEDQAHALDESMAVDPDTDDMPDQFQPEEMEKQNRELDDVTDIEESSPQQEQQPNAYDGRAGAILREAKQNPAEDSESAQTFSHEDIEDEVGRVDNQLESTHLDNLDDVGKVSASSACEQWTRFENLTRDLSLSLTEQLRLILAPTLATKMRGDFRTGKRLNIKRIIPYIASQYKRDKIWMRRSVPSKRSYQIILAVDDSKSMVESGSGSLAFETLVMISKSLSMLEVGEVCVLGFGEKVKVAHDFETPFSSDAGPRIFQNFAFEQNRTDVTKLMKDSIEIFRAARAKASGTPADLWQMELIISDGVCDSSEHDAIRRLLREALEERIMMVFVIVDDVTNKKKGESVMDLKEAKFVKDEATGASNVKIERYLDTFPFQYYVIVSDVKELPRVLAALLRQWFAEVVDAST